MSDQTSSSKNQALNALVVPDMKLDQFIDLLPCYISIQDREHRLLYVNQLLKEDFGDATGKQCYIVFKGRPNKCRSCPVEKTFKDKRIHSGEETFQVAGGKICQMFVQSSPILDETGEITAVVEMATNITQIKKGHKELTTLGQSIALLSHGIKNILEGLQGGAYVVDEAFKDGDLELARKGWKIVNKNITDISDTVQNILYSAKNRPLNYERISPIQLIKDSVELFQEKAAAMDVRLSQRVNAAVPDVDLDTASIRRMLHNLIWNALEACHKDKAKKAHAVQVTVDFYDAHHFVFEIADNGIGMDQSIQRNIFEEFFSTKGSGGTGLGLAVVEKVVNKHGGRIEVSSQPGKGSTFKIIFQIR